MELTPMTPLPTPQSELLEEALSDIFECNEENVVAKDQVAEILNKKIQTNFLEELKSKGLVRFEDGKVKMSEPAEEIAAHVIRRKRLAERLMKDVLNLSDEVVDPAACQWEHILSKEVTNSICTLLGHPSLSPRDKLIPRGECCKNSITEVSAVICSLDKLGRGDRGKITYLMLKKNPDLHRLLSLGLVPGTQIELIQKVPTFVVEVNESQLAFDKSIAEAIFVHPLSS